VKLHLMPSLGKVSWHTHQPSGLMMQKVTCSLSSCVQLIVSSTVSDTMPSWLMQDGYVSAVKTKKGTTCLVQTGRCVTLWAFMRWRHLRCTLMTVTATLKLSCSSTGREEKNLAIMRSICSFISPCTQSARAWARIRHI